MLEIGSPDQIGKQQVNTLKRQVGQLVMPSYYGLLA